jgi:hypothetical protein
LRRQHGIESPHPKSQLLQPIIQPNKAGDIAAAAGSADQVGRRCLDSI